MQTTSARQAWKSLASKIHPQLPLTTRESQQLLNLLTTSFRTHLDREHPTAPSEPPPASTSTQLIQVEQSRRLPSSYDSASEHIDSILSNPLFARKPSRRGSDSAVTNALNDPVAWFLDQAAIGAADVSKASLCIDLCKRRQSNTKLPRDSLSGSHQRPASMIAEWLRTSGEETSREFLIYHPPVRTALGKTVYRYDNHLVAKLAPLLLAEDNLAPLWRWYTYEPENGDALKQAEVSPFKAQLLRTMVDAARTRDEAFAIFQYAFQMADAGKRNGYATSLGKAAAYLVNAIVADHQVQCTPELYEQFALSTGSFVWKPVVQAMLCLYHPTEPDPQPILKIVKSPDSFLASAQSKSSRRRFVVRMCLGAAQQLIKEGKLADAQIVMNFAKEYFGDLVLVKYKSSHISRIKEEKKNIALLDGFLAT